MLVGVVGTGKSTLCDKLLENSSDLTLVSTDSFVEAYAKEQGKTYDDVHREMGDKPQKMMMNQIRELINQKKGFIWDQTNVFKSARKKKLAFLRQNKYQVIAITIELTNDELEKRLRKRIANGGKKVPFKIIKDMMEGYERPSYDEGFLDIYLIENDGVAHLLEKTTPDLNIGLSGLSCRN